jgi:hypothetical protein
MVRRYKDQFIEMPQGIIKALKYYIGEKQDKNMERLTYAVSLYGTYVGDLSKDNRESLLAYLKAQDFNLDTYLTTVKKRQEDPGNYQQIRFLGIIQQISTQAGEPLIPEDRFSAQVQQYIENIE